MLISIIIPCYNVENYIEKAINSCIHQTYTNLEIICVDNGSTDGTVEIIKKFPKIKLLTEPCKGAPFARNTGFRAAAGEWIQFLDADDILKPDKISAQVKLIEQSKNSSAGVILSPYKRISVKGNEYSVPLETNDFWLGLFQSQLGITSSNLWRKESLHKNKGWDTRLASSQEYDLLFRITKAGYSSIVDDEVNTLVYDRESGSISTSDPIPRWKTYVDLRIQMLDFVVSQKINEKFHSFYAGIVLGQIRKLSSYNLEIASEKFKELAGIINPRLLQSNFIYKTLLLTIGFKKTQTFLSRFGKY